MRTIRVSGGFSDYVEAELSDVRGPLKEVPTVKVALVLEDTAPPAKADSAWRTPQLSALTSEGAVRVSLLLTAGQAAGHFELWALLDENPLAVPVQAFEEDGRPFLVHVT